MSRCRCCRPAAAGRFCCSPRTARCGARRNCWRALPYPLFVQGTAPRHQLLNDFRESGDGVLLGAASFWEGVDVAGEALSCVIIDKLPFAAPDDPLLQARLEALRARAAILSLTGRCRAR